MCNFLTQPVWVPVFISSDMAYLLTSCNNQASNKSDGNESGKNLINHTMVQYRVNITVMDYYDYVGTHPYYSIKERVWHSIPQTLRKGYNIKFKRVKRTNMWDTHKYYRVHISFKGTEEQWDWILKDVENLTHLYSNFSYKEIKVAKGH